MHTHAEHGTGWQAVLRVSVWMGMACCFVPSPLMAGGVEQEKPNVLFIAVDDLNDWVGAFHGNTQVRTPNLDRLAQSGVRFSHAYCAAPACNPSRTSLLTGVRPSSSGVYHNDQPWRPVMPDVVTLPEYFMRHGYEVVGCGKIFHGKYKERKAWHDYFGVSHFTPHPPKAQLPLNGLGRYWFDWGPMQVDDHDMADYKVADYARSFLQKQHTRPFFLAVGIFRPHLPWYVPAKYFAMYPEDRVHLPEVLPNDLADVPRAGVAMARSLDSAWPDDHKAVVESGQWKQAVTGYLASITFADMCVGRVLEALRQSPYSGNTVIVLWGDHGWHLGEKEHWRKFTLWEEATRIPLIFAGAGIKHQGQTCSRTVNLMDVYPTLLELCGLPRKEGIEATSIRPLLDDPQHAWTRPAVTTYGFGNHAVRSERWRYIRYHDGTEELYDHERDPNEWHNLAGLSEYRDVTRRLAAWLPATNQPDAPRDARNRQRATYSPSR